MKNTILLLFIYLVTFNLTAQVKASDALTIEALINISDMSKENANKWLTKENHFAFFQESQKYDASIYTFDYNTELKRAPIWLYHFENKNEVFVIVKKSDASSLLEQLEVNKFLSKLNPDGTLITTYLSDKKEIIVTITSKQEVSIRLIPSPKGESDADQKIRHNKLINKN